MKKLPVESGRDFTNQVIIDQIAPEVYSKANPKSQTNLSQAIQEEAKMAQGNKKIQTSPMKNNALLVVFLLIGLISLGLLIFLGIKSFYAGNLQDYTKNSPQSIYTNNQRPETILGSSVDQQDQLKQPRQQYGIAQSAQVKSQTNKIQSKIKKATQSKPVIQSITQKITAKVKGQNSEKQNLKNSGPTVKVRQSEQKANIEVLKQKPVQKTANSLQAQTNSRPSVLINDKKNIAAQKQQQKQSEVKQVSQKEQNKKEALSQIRSVIKSGKPENETKKSLTQLVKAKQAEKQKQIIASKGSNAVKVADTTKPAEKKKTLEVDAAVKKGEQIKVATQEKEAASKNKKQQESKIVIPAEKQKQNKTAQTKQFNIVTGQVTKKEAAEKQATASSIAKPTITQKINKIEDNQNKAVKPNQQNVVVANDSKKNQNATQQKKQNPIIQAPKASIDSKGAEKKVAIIQQAATKNLKEPQKSNLNVQVKSSNTPSAKASLKKAN